MVQSLFELHLVDSQIAIATLAKSEKLLVNICNSLELVQKNSSNLCFGMAQGSNIHFSVDPVNVENRLVCTDVNPNPIVLKKSDKKKNKKLTFDRNNNDQVIAKTYALIANALGSCVDPDIFLSKNPNSSSSAYPRRYLPVHKKKSSVLMLLEVLMSQRRIKT